MDEICKTQIRYKRHGRIDKHAKKEYARMLYLKENLTQQEIAEKTGVSRQTLSRWINSENGRR